MYDERRNRPLVLPHRRGSAPLRIVPQAGLIFICQPPSVKQKAAGVDQKVGGAYPTHCFILGTLFYGRLRPVSRISWRSEASSAAVCGCWVTRFFVSARSVLRSYSSAAAGDLAGSVLPPFLPEACGGAMYFQWPLRTARPVACSTSDSRPCWDSPRSAGKTLMLSEAASRDSPSLALRACVVSAAKLVKRSSWEIRASLTPGLTRAGQRRMNG